MKFDLYDFDKTVFPVDSESVFYLFCLVRHPWLIVILPYQLVCLACFFLKIGGDKMKGRFFCFLRFVNTEKMVKNSWLETRPAKVRATNTTVKRMVTMLLTQSRSRNR